MRYTSTLLLPFKKTQIPSHTVHKAPYKDRLGSAGTLGIVAVLQGIFSCFGGGECMQCHSLGFRVSRFWVKG